MHPRRLIVAIAVLGTASPAAATFDGAAEHPGSAARAAGVFRPVAAAPPAVTSAARLGATLAASPGQWTRDPDAFSLRWSRCRADGATCTPIEGPSAVSAADIGHRLRVEVTATNAGGSATAVSAPSAGVPPEPRAPGAVSGTATAGSALTFTSGGWTLNPALAATTRRAWWRCPTSAWSADACVRLTATGTTYTPVAGDVGAYLRVVETSEQGGFPADAVSAATATPVAAVSARLPATAQANTGPAAPNYGLERIADTSWTTNFMTSYATAPVRAGQWVRVDFASVKTLTRYRLEHRVSATAGFPEFVYAIEASADGASWTALRLPADPTMPKAFAGGDVTLPAAVRARYLRLRAVTDTGMGWDVYGLEGWGF